MRGKILLTFIISMLDSQFFLPQSGLYFSINSDKEGLGFGWWAEACSDQGTCDLLSVLFLGHQFSKRLSIIKYIS